MQGLDDDIEEALRRCDEQKDPAKRERCKERVIATRFKAMRMKIDSTAADHARLESKIDDLSTREEFKQQAKEIQDIFTRRVDEAVSGRADARYLENIGAAITSTLKDLDKTVAKKSDLERFATKDDLKAFATKDDLAGVKSDVKSIIDKIDRLASAQ
nr:hypothetical protein [Candidatus Sigynarchaeum springense]